MMIRTLLLRGSRRGAEAPRAAGRIDARRGGFTLVELMVVTAIVGILAGLAIPNMRTVLLRARATELVGDIEVVRLATQNYHGSNLTWPGEAGPGAIPAGLDTYLPDGYSFNRDGYDLDYENWSFGEGGLPGDPSTHTLIGVSLVVADPSLGNALTELLGSAILFSVGNTHTVVIDRS